MTTREARLLFDYNSWANARMFSAAEALTAEQLGAPVVSSFPSLIATLAHMVETEWVWLRRWRGESPAASPAWADEPSLRELKAQLGAIEAERASFLAGRRMRIWRARCRTTAGMGRRSRIRSRI
jgi:uncharacterized damage-inducible protein DinB